jgi:tRNA (adenine57-N1/adenine58-N1)-methyltransferase
MDTPNWGDHVLLRCIHRRKQYLIRLKNGATLNTQLGAVSHDEIKKRTYGDIVEFGNSQKGSWKNKVVILRPTFQDIVIKISRSCTPVYPKDMAQIAMLLNLKEGDRVLEAGTGSGLFAMFLSRCVGKTGEVWSYETREDFYKDAQLRANVLHPNHNIKFFLGNVTTCNPPVPFDAIVLDLADPWTVISTLVSHLRLGASLVCILPNMTQIIHLLHTLKQQKVPLLFESMEEVSVRQWQCNLPTLRPAFQIQRHTAFLLTFRRTKEYIEIRHEKEKKLQESGADYLIYSYIDESVENY